MPDLPDIPKFWAWAAALASLVSGPIAVWQLIEAYVRRRTRRVEREHWQAAKDAMVDIRSTIVEAMEKGEPTDSANFQSWASGLNRHVMTAERHIDATLRAL